MRRIVINIAIAIGLLGTVAVVAYPMVMEEGRPWPKGTVISIYESPSVHRAYHHQLVRAVKRWNRASVGVTFALTPHAAGATVLAQTAKTMGEAKDICDSVGGAPRIAACVNNIGFNPYRQTVIEVPEKTSHPWATIGVVVWVHELGHIVGLTHAHDKQCSVMNYNKNPCPENGSATLLPPDCPVNQSPAERWYTCNRVSVYNEQCGPYPEDITRARKLYNIATPAPSRDSIGTCHPFSVRLPAIKTLVQLNNSNLRYSFTGNPPMILQDQPTAMWDTIIANKCGSLVPTDLIAVDQAGAAKSILLNGPKPLRAVRYCNRWMEQASIHGGPYTTPHAVQTYSTIAESLARKAG